MEETEKYEARIMIVDDTPQNLRLLENMLSSRGYKVYALPNGEMALNAVKKNPPDLILLDINMPGMNGYEVCRRLKENPASANIPVIFLSAMHDIADKMDGFAAGGVDYITKPFQFEGKRRNAQAEEGIVQLRDVVDTLIVVPNQRLLSLGGRGLSLIEAFKKADDILYQAVKGISDLIIVPGLINLDFADVKSIMSSMGMALMGTGTASGENRAVEAAQRAISSPLLEDNTIQGAQGILLSITGGPDMSLYEVNEASSLIQAEAHEDANIIFGTVIDENMKDEIRITVIATGFEDAKKKQVPSNVTHLGGFRREDLSTPAFMRKSKSGDPANVVTMGVNDENENVDIDIPTFLRRQAD